MIIKRNRIASQGTGAVGFSFFVGLLAGVTCYATASGVFAAGGIKSVGFNDNKIRYNGEEIYLEEDHMISVVSDGEEHTANYMPLRRVLEGMGLYVEWDADSNTVLISD